MVNKPGTKALMLAAGLLLTAIVLAQAPPPPRPVSPNAGGGAAGNVRSPAKNNADRRFKPSEEISEDIPVAFPVDI